MLLFTLDHITDMVICLDKDAHIFYANHAAIAKLGHNTDTLFNYSIYNIAPHFTCETWPAFWAMLEQETAFEMDSLLITNHNDEMVVNMSFTYLIHEQHSYCCMISRDITARQQIEVAIQDLNNELTTVIGEQEQKLQDSETRLLNLADNIPGMIYQMCLDLNPAEDNQSLTFTYASSGCMDVFGFFPEALQANSHLLFKRVHPDDVDELRSSLLNSARTFDPWNWEGRIISANGQIKWLQGRAQPSYELDHQVVWDGVFIDVSSAKRRQQALQCIVESTTPQFGQTFVQSCAMAIAQSLQMQYVIISEIVTTLDHEPLRVRTLAFWQGDQFGADLEYDLFGTPCNQVFQTRAIYHGNQTLQSKFPEAELINKFDISSYVGIPIPDPSGELLGHIAVMDPHPIRRDSGLQDYVLQIFATRVGTEIGRQRATAALRESETQLRQQTIELENALRDVQQTHAKMLQSEKMSSLGELVAGVAHEINNPVSFIYGNVRHAHAYAQDLLDLISLYRAHYPNPVVSIHDLLEEVDIDFVMEDLPKTLSSMKMGADRIKQIVTSLRTFSRMDESEKEPINIHEGLDSTVMILQNRLKARSDRPEIRIHREYGNVSLVKCYGGQLNQVFMNLLSNAIDAIDEGVVESNQPCTTDSHRQPYIRLQTCPVDDYVKIHIVDNGVGMPEAVRSRLFTTFFTTKPVGKGTGMGLSISHQIITEKHGGTLECFSSPGQGTEFIITIPL
ncbi:MAG: PAS domain-containing protein [Cyanothece sp. SIO2G6]|nr:PAS domain-containing protein [Cyanothece sp. SIO2G6]